MALCSRPLHQFGQVISPIPRTSPTVGWLRNPSGREEALFGAARDEILAEKSPGSCSRGGGDRVPAEGQQVPNGGALLLEALEHARLDDGGGDRGIPGGEALRRSS